MPARRLADRGRCLALGLLLALLAGCHSAAVEHEAPHDYGFVLAGGGWLSAPAELSVRLTFDDGEVLYVRLQAPSGQAAATVAREWTHTLNRRRQRTAEWSDNTVVVRRVVRIAWLGASRGLELRDLGLSAGVPAEEPG